MGATFIDFIGLLIVKGKHMGTLHPSASWSFLCLKDLDFIIALLFTFQMMSNN